MKKFTEFVKTAVSIVRDIMPFIAALAAAAAAFTAAFDDSSKSTK